MTFIESETIELKSSVVADLCKEVIAFANTRGGTVAGSYFLFEFKRALGMRLFQNTRNPAFLRFEHSGSVFPGMSAFGRFQTAKARRISLVPPHHPPRKTAAG